MKQSTPTSKEDTANRLAEDTVQIFPINKRSVDCQVCKTRLQDGEPATAYAIRANPYAPWRIGQIRCAEHSLSLDALSTLGVDEVVATGRVGRVTDQAYQRDWPALLAENIEAISQRNKNGAAEPPLPAVPDSARPTPHNHSPGGQT
jgi:hypothetical protein